MKQRRWFGTVVAMVVAVGGAGYYSAGQAGRSVAATATSPVALQPGYAIQQIAGQLTGPVGIAIGSNGVLYVAESGWNTGTPPRVLALGPGKARKTLTADFTAPLTGLTMHEGKLLVSYAGGIDRLDPATGSHTPVLRNLPTGGDHSNYAVAVGADGRLYFGIGSATNAGVVGEDNLRAGWVKPDSTVRDIPCKDVTVKGSNFTIPNTLTPDPHDMATTGAFSAFGKTTARLQVVPGAVPCTGAILRVKADGTGLSMVAWGLRNPAGVAFGPDGLLYATMQGYEDRGSRPILSDHDYLYRIDEDRWYGWPDFAGGRSVTEEEFQKPSLPVTPLLADPPEQPPAPVATFAPGSGAMGMAFPAESFGLRGDALVALRGSLTPLTDGEPPPGPMVARVSPRSGMVTPFARNRSAGDAGGFAHPVAVVTAPDGSVYVVDYGEVRPHARGYEPTPGTGRVFRISRTKR